MLERLAMDEGSSSNGLFVRDEEKKSLIILTPVWFQFYFYIPILIMVSFNTIMFCMTVYKLWKHQRDTRY
jgi:hypothetical protein